MARDWVKLWACIIDDPEMCGMEPAAFQTLILSLAKAGHTDDGGRVATLDNLAWVLHVTPADLESRIRQTGGRLELRTDEPGGPPVVWVRDWSQWQTKRFDPTADDRRRRFLEAKAAKEPPKNATGRNRTQPDAEKRQIDEIDKIRRDSAAEPAAGPSEPAKARERDPWFDAFCAAWDIAKPSKAEATLAGAFGRECRQAGATLAEFEQYLAIKLRSGDWGQFVKPHSTTREFLAWRKTRQATKIQEGTDWTR